MRTLWRLPYTTHCNLLHTINISLPIEMSLEKRSVKSIWSSLNMENFVVVKYVFLSCGFIYYLYLHVFLPN